MTPAHLTTVAIRTALVENPPGKVPVSSGLVMIERGTQPNGDRISGDIHFSRKGVPLWASRPSEGECAETKTKDQRSDHHDVCVSAFEPQLKMGDTKEKH